MLNNFNEILSASVADRRELFEAAGEEIGTLASYAEKDFWVCLILEILFNHRAPSDPRLLFKGGTSLSKVYGLINRFSEDIDITIFAGDLGLEVSDLDSFGSKRRKRFFNELGAACDVYLFDSLIKTLEQALLEAGAAGTRVLEGDDHCIFVEYPSVFDGGVAAYVKPRVIIEGGARSATIPHEFQAITPYIEQVGPFDLAIQNICTIKAERSFCDKLVILHALRCGYDREGRIPKDRNRASRHYYDVAMMTDSDIGNEAIFDIELQESVRKHAERLFPARWRGYDTACAGTFSLVPRGDLLRALKIDYNAMKGMIFGEVPRFETILETIARLETRINAGHEVV